jgi:hypothetical protein
MRPSKQQESYWLNRALTITIFAIPIPDGVILNGAVLQSK